jgi:hypothetical protein
MQKRGHKIALNLIPGADHNYSNHLRAMETCVQEYVRSKLAPEVISLEKKRPSGGQTALAG